MKKHLLLLSGVIIMLVSSSLTYGQYNDPKRWNVDPRMTKISLFGEALPFSEESLHYKNPNTKPRIYITPSVIVTVSPNFRVHPSGIPQSETPIVSSAVNRNWIFGSSNAFINGSIILSEGIYLSTDGGQNWFGSDTCGATPINTHGGDPGPAIGPDGTIYMSYLDLAGLRCGVSTDWGVTWGPGHILTSSGADKNLTTVNDVAGNLYYGRALVAWSDFGNYSIPIMVSWSSDNGSNWSTAVDINAPDSGHFSQGVNPQVGPNGEFYLIWANNTRSIPLTEDYMGFAKSIDGGVTWTVNNNIYDVNGIRGTLTNKNSIRVNGLPWMAVDRSGGMRNGWIYAVEAEKYLSPAGTDPDIIFHRSTDGGTTWSGGIRVNQDPLNNGANQYMPAVCVGDDGSINVVYYDSRNTPSNQAEVFVSHSTDGGDSWIDIMVSDHDFTPSPIPGISGGYQGDYIGICPGPDGKYYPLWCDNSSGTYQAWTTVVSFEPQCLSVDQPTYPNPGNGAIEVPINLIQITWNNGTGANTNETYFGTNPDSLELVQLGSLSTSWIIDPTYLPLSYNTTYYWKVVEIGDTCSTSGTIWSFHTEQGPNYFTIIDTLFPDNSQYWTGNTEGTIKTDGEINTIYPNVGWAEFDVGSIPAVASIDQITFYGYINSMTLPFWSATPMGIVNPVIDPASVINIQIQSNYEQSTAYIYSTDLLFFTGWYSFPLINNAVADLQNAILSSRGWFAMGFIDWDFEYPYCVNFDGWTQQNPPYLVVQYHYITPVELTLFNVTSNQGNVKINWSTASETNNQGFEVERKIDNGQFHNIAFVEGAGTTVQPHSYSLIDKNLSSGSYTYRLKQIDFSGSFEYSKAIEIKINMSEIFSLAQNYPDPFNPTTNIKYSLPDDGMVSLKMYDILGKEVLILVNENQKAGEHSVSVYAANLSSGVYIYRLQAENFCASRKMILLK